MVLLPCKFQMIRIDLIPLLIAAIAFAEFYIPFVELSKIALSFVVFNVVFRSLV